MSIAIDDDLIIFGKPSENLNVVKETLVERFKVKECADASAAALITAIVTKNPHQGHAY